MWQTLGATRRREKSFTFTNFQAKYYVHDGGSGGGGGDADDADGDGDDADADDADDAGDGEGATKEKEETISFTKDSFCDDI